MQDRGSSLTELRPGTVPAAIGAELARARERLGLTIADAARGLRIKPAYLEALEAGSLDRLPGPVYALAFLRLYSGALGLDAERMASRCKAASAAFASGPRLAFPQPAAKRGLPAGASAMLAAVLAIGAYAGWYRLSAEGRLPPETVPPVPQQLALLAEPQAPAIPALAAALPAPPPRPEPASPALPEAPARALSPTQAAAATTITAEMPAPSASDRTGPAANPAEPERGLRVRALADAWIQVRDRQGRVLLSRILRAGEVWPVPEQRSDLLLTTGNAGGTEIVVNGIGSGPLGAPRAVRRELPLDPDLVKPGRAALLAPIAAAR